jgi:hypothetical protein
MEHALVLRGKCVRANMRCNLGQTVPARAGDPTADKLDQVVAAQHSLAVEKWDWLLGWGVEPGLK